MLDRIEKQDYVNAGWLAVALFGAALLAVIGIFWGMGVFKNDVVLSVPSPTTLEAQEKTPEEKTFFQVANGTDETGYADRATSFLKSEEYASGIPINSEEKIKMTSVYYKASSAVYQNRKSEALEMASAISINSDQVEPFPSNFTLKNLDERADILIILGTDAKF